MTAGGDDGTQRSVLVDQTGRAAISVAEARHLVLARIVPLAPRRVVIGGAAGQVQTRCA
jgi:hypothetical protein